MTNSSIFLFFALLAPFYLGKAQSIETIHEHARIQKIIAEDGLSQNSVSSIIKDREGFMWIGTADGLNRYDGYNFKVYKNKYSDSTSIGSSKINCIYEDSNGRLWIGTGDGGLNLFDKKKETFKKYLYNPNDNNSISQNGVNCIMEDSRHNLWIGTFWGVNVFNYEENKFTRYFTDPDGLVGNSIFAFAEDRKGRIWVGTKNGLNIIDPDKKSIITYINNPKDSKSISKNRITDILVDSEGNIWIGTEGGGLNLFVEETNSFHHFRHDPENSNSLASDIVRKIIEDENGDLWIGTDEEGISIFSKKQKKFRRLFSKNDPGIIATAIYDIYQDDEGLIWLGTYGEGVKLVNRKRKKFTHYEVFDSHMELMNKNSVLAFTEDKNHHIWIGTNGAGLYEFDPSTKKFINYIHDPDNSNSISGNIVKSILIGDDGLIYIGTYAKGLNIMDPKVKSFKNFMPDPNDSNSICNPHVWALLQDSENRIWVGTLGGGLDEFIIDKQIFRHQASTSANQGTINCNYISKIFEDRSKNIWVATYGGGINKLVKNDREEPFRAFRHNANDPSSLSNDDVMEIFEDSKGRLWLGTIGGGLNYFDDKKDTFVGVNEKEDIPNSILSIMEDDSGNLWMGTYNGLCKYNPETSIVKKYDIYDGLQANEFNINAKLKSSTGAFYFGGVNGFNVFSPDSITDNYNTPRIVFTDFYLFHKEISSAQNSKTLPSNINYLDHIVLKSNENVISIGYTALEYNFPKNNQYAYYLKEFDENWNYVGKQRIATYTNLPPGTYVFQVKCSNNDGIWNDEIAQIKIEILHHWYGERWAQLLFFFGIALLIALIIQIRTKILFNQKKKLEHQIKNRTRQILYQKSEIEVKNHELNSQNKKISQQNEELLAKNEEIYAQREQILEKTMLLQDAHEKIKQANYELQSVNSNLEKLVETRTSELREAIEKLISKDEELNLFIYRSSHDLRGPITTLMGLSHLAKKENEKRDIDHYFDKMQQSCIHMLKVLKKLNDTNLIFKIEKKVLILDWEQILEEIFKDLESIDPEKKVRKTINNKITQNVFSDPFLVKTIIHNILENAIVFRNPKNPYANLWLNLEENNLMIRVEDNGRGMDKEVQRNLFKMFYRGSQASIGNGLGLYIVKKSVEILNGEITIESKLNHFSIFEVKIPVDN